MHPTAIEHYVIPWGNWGVRKTLRRMRKLVRDAQASPLLIETAGSIVSTHGPANKAHRIRDYLAATVQFVPDPVGIELIRSPVYMLRQIESKGTARGDCDDVATLGAALGKAVGMPARFVVQSFAAGQPYGHVFTELATPAGWVELDTTAPAQIPAGLTVHSEETYHV